MIISKESLKPKQVRWAVLGVALSAMVLSIAVPATANASATPQPAKHQYPRTTTKGLTAEKFDKYQVFDVQRSPAWPTCSKTGSTTYSTVTYSTFKEPYSSASNSRFTLETYYLKFYKRGTVTTPWGVKLYNTTNQELYWDGASWTTVNGPGSEAFDQQGQLYGASHTGLLLVSDSYGTYFSPAQSFDFSSPPFTYTPVATFNTCEVTSKLSSTLVAVATNLTTWTVTLTAAPLGPPSTTKIYIKATSLSVKKGTPSPAYAYKAYTTTTDVNAFGTPIATPPTCTSAYTSSATVGATFTITCSGGKEKGYTLIYQSGTLTVISNTTGTGTGTGTGTSSTVTSSPSKLGYVVADQIGGIFAYGQPAFVGSLPERGVTPNAPVVDVVATATGKGYWEVAADGGVFAFGNAWWWGSMAGHDLNSPIIAMAATPTDGGYWLLSADGGVFAFGNAWWYGSLVSRSIGTKAVGIAATPTGGGYWIASSNGAVYAFGNASWFGSMIGRKMNAPIVGIASTQTGAGYWLVGSDGGVFAFGSAWWWGSMGGQPLNAPVIGITPTPTGGGYFELASDGGVFAFGNAWWWGSPTGITSGHAVGLSLIATISDVPGAKPAHRAHPHLTTRHSHKRKR